MCFQEQERGQIIFVEEEKRGRGRPKKWPSETKSKRVNFRITEDEFEALDFVSKQLKKSHSDTCRLLIQEANGILFERLKK